jgi:hypothetical protein
MPNSPDIIGAAKELKEECRITGSRFPYFVEGLLIAVEALEKIAETAPMQARTKLLAEEALSSIRSLPLS